MSSTTRPDDLPVAEGRLVHPLGTRIDQIVLDPRASGGAMSPHDSGRDAYQSRVADQSHDLLLLVGIGNYACHLGVTAKLVGGPSPGHHDDVEVVGRRLSV